MERIKPMLCRGEAKPTNNPNLIWEQKYDGARIIASVNGDYQLQSRSGKDKSHLFPELRLETRLSAVLDGEIIAADESKGFNGIQSRINRSNNISWASQQYPARLVLFDVLEIDGSNVETMPLMSRKELLSQLVKQTENVFLAPYQEDGEALFLQMVSRDLEGVIGKRKDGKYLRDKREWIKVKTWQTGTFFVCGYTQGTGWRESTFGALVLMDAHRKYVGQVGTGMDATDIRGLMSMFVLAPCPWAGEPEAATWVRPFPVKVQYLEYTNDGILRFPSLKGVM